MDVHDPRSAFQHAAGEDAALARLHSFVRGCSQKASTNSVEEGAAEGQNQEEGSASRLNSYKATRAQVRGATLMMLKLEVSDVTGAQYLARVLRRCKQQACKA